MVRALLSAVGRFSPEAYLTACKRAVETGDSQRVRTMVEEAESHLSEPYRSYCTPMPTTERASSKT